MIHIYTDGSCQVNPGPGGWAAIIERDGEKRELAGHEDGTTNNRMEITAAIKGYQKSFDSTHGGLRRAPKFPSSLPVRLLLRHYSRTGDQAVLDMAALTLEKMAAALRRAA